MKKLLVRTLNKNEGRVRRLSGNKGFSLIELLIVIAIMGVLAAIAFNMFGGVLTNSKKRADEQQGKNIERALLTYCLDSGDWHLNNGISEGGTGETDLAGADSTTLITFLLKQVTVDGKDYGPMLSPKYPEDTDVTSDRNIEAYLPQWRTDKDGDYEGWKVDVYRGKMAVQVVPTAVASEAVVTIYD